jgi:hypothetical protein
MTRTPAELASTVRESLVTADWAAAHERRSVEALAELERQAAEGNKYAHTAREHAFARAEAAEARTQQLEEAIVQFSESTVEATHALYGQGGCPHCEAEGALYAIARAVLAAGGPTHRAPYDPQEHSQLPTSSTLSIPEDA